MALWIIAGVFLGIGAVWDIKKLALPRVWLSGGMVVSFCLALYGYFTGKDSIVEGLVACLPGIISLFVSLLTREQIGYGDGAVLVILGGLLGSNVTWMIWLTGLGMVFVVGILLLVTGKGNGKTKIPFLPFLLLGYLLAAGGKVL